MEMDVELDPLSNAVINIFDGWEPAEIFAVKHEKTVPKWRVSKSHKNFFLDRPNFITESDVELSGLSKDMNILSIGWEPAELLNGKHDARRVNAFPMSRYSK